MYEPRQKVMWFALVSRLAVFVLQFLFNFLFTDHDAEAFKLPVSGDEISGFDRAMEILFSGLSRWDGQYFIHIAKNGYTYENNLVFFPLFPFTVRFVAIILGKVLFMASEDNVIIISGVIVNLFCFVKSALILYDLSEKILASRAKAYRSAILYCINPASIFFTALYTESMFAYLTFYSMLTSVERSFYVYLPIGLSTLVRSNGLVNLGFTLYYQAKDIVNFIRNNVSVFNRGSDARIKQTFAYTLFQFTVKIINTALLSLLPFFLLQVHNYIQFCIPRNRKDIPDDITQYAVDNKLVLTGSGRSKWCLDAFPVAYSYLQEKYWNVGLLNYYLLKQIPNFLLAAPVLFIMLKFITEYLCEHRAQLYTLGFVDSVAQSKTAKYPKEMFVFIIHGLFLTVFCVLYVHIEVSTRLLCSASPLIYWYCAIVLSRESNSKSLDEDLYSKWRVFIFTKDSYSMQEILIIAYFLGYFVVGTLMFSNFMPWT